VELAHDAGGGLLRLDALRLERADELDLVGDDQRQQGGHPDLHAEA